MARGPALDWVQECWRTLVGLLSWSIWVVGFLAVILEWSDYWLWPLVGLLIVGGVLEAALLLRYVGWPILKVVAAVPYVLLVELPQLMFHFLRRKESLERHLRS